MCSCPIRLQISLIINISGKKKNQCVGFLHRDSNQWKITCKTTAVVPCHTQTLDLPGENLDGLGVGMAKLEVIQNESLIEF